MSSFLKEAYNKPPPHDVLEEAANVILAYCMTATFLIRNQNIEVDVEHIMYLVKYLHRGKDSIDFNSPETATGTVDQISLRMAKVSPAAREFIVERLSENDHMIMTIIAYVNNNTKFRDLAALVTNNGVTNRIIVDLSYISADSPREVSVFIDNTKVEAFSSFMPIYDVRSGVGGIGQKELQDDYGYATHRKFLNSCLGLDIGEDNGVYYSTAHNNGTPTSADIELATRNIYEEVCRRLNEGLSGTLDTIMFCFKETLLESMIGCCFGVDLSYDGECIVISNNKYTSESFNAQELYERLNSTPLSAICPEKLNPSIRIVDNNKKELFKVRFKKEKYPTNVTGHRYKLYFTTSIT